MLVRKYYLMIRKQSKDKNLNLNAMSLVFINKSSSLRVQPVALTCSFVRTCKRAYWGLVSAFKLPLLNFNKGKSCDCRSENEDEPSQVMA